MARDYRSPEAREWRKLYQTKEWKAIRAKVLSARPLCEACLRRGVYIPSRAVNHVRKADKADPRTFFRGPFTALCLPCHDAGEQKAEAAGFSAEAGSDGWPIDPRHPANRKRA